MRASIAQIVTVTEAEGPGKRFALWFQGCPLRCAACCNPEMLPFAGGTPMDTASLIAEMLASQQSHGIEGITLLGGEPFAHAEAAAELAIAARAYGMSVMVFSGYVLEELQRRSEPEVATLLANIDLLVDGPYERDMPDTSRRWIGSTNQRIHFLTDRYAFDDDVWEAPNTLEIRWANGELVVNGFPGPRVKALWQRTSATERRP